MKMLKTPGLFLITILFLLSINSCVKTGCTNPAASNYDPSAKKDNGKCQVPGCNDPAAHNYNNAATSNSGCIYYGKVTFYLDRNWSGVSVNVGDSVGHITQIDSTGAPTCGATGCANFSLPVGTYTYGAAGVPNGTWYGSVLVGKDSCSVVLLH